MGSVRAILGVQERFLGFRSVTIGYAADFFKSFNAPSEKFSFLAHRPRGLILGVSHTDFHLLLIDERKDFMEKPRLAR